MSGPLLLHPIVQSVAFAATFVSAAVENMILKAGVPLLTVRRVSRTPAFRALRVRCVLAICRRRSSLRMFCAVGCLRVSWAVPCVVLLRVGVCFRVRVQCANLGASVLHMMFLLLFGEQDQSSASC